MSWFAAATDGIMLEVHPDPENAAVDPLQAIDFQSFGELINDIERIGTIVNKYIPKY